MTAIEEHSLKTQLLLSGASNYNRWIYETLRPHLGRRIVDVGCGLGNITQFFMDRDRVIAMDAAPAAVSRTRERFRDRANFTALLGDIADGSIAGRIAPERPDTVVCLNVLEHLRDDVSSLVHMREMLVEGGRVRLLVPALRALYVSMDAADGHVRRFQKYTLREAVRASGMRIECLRYFNFLGILGWFVNARILKRTCLPEGQLGWFDRAVPFLRRIEKGLSPSAGQSLYAVCRKPADGPSRASNP